MDNHEAYVLKEMREPPKVERPQRRSFMHPDELRRLRCNVIRATQKALAEQLLSPESGEPVSNFTVCRWEAGARPVPLWAARRIRNIAEIASRHDLELPGGVK